MCISRIAFGKVFKKSDSPFKDNRFSEKIMGPDFAFLLKAHGEAMPYFKSLKREIISVSTFDGLKLDGLFFACPQTSSDTVILVHGYNSSPEGDFPVITRYYLENGFNVLCTNNRGGKNGDGDDITFGIFERLDTALWVDEIAKRHPDGNIVLHGVSLGGATVCMMSELTLKNVCAVISDCAYTSVRDEFDYTTKFVAGFTPRRSLEKMYRIFEKTHGLSVDEFTPLKAVANAKYPILFIHGKEDRFIPVSMAYELFDACPAKKELYIVEGAGHAASCVRNPAEYAARTLEFIKGCKR